MLMTLRIELVNQVGGAIQVLRVQDTTLYVGTPTTLSIYDVSAMAPPRRQGYCMIPGRVSDLVIAGRYAYVTDAHFGPTAGLRIIDVADPTAPQEVSFFPTRMPANHLALMDHYALITADTDGLRILDISTPSAVREIGRIQLMGPEPPHGRAGVQRTWKICVYGHYAYVQAGDIHIIDLCDPTNPQVVGRLPLPAAEWLSELGIMGETLYTQVENRLTFLNLATPAHPQIISTYEAPNIHSVVAGDHTLYLAQAADPAETTPPHVCMLDLRNPRAPVVLAEYRTLTVQAPLTYAHGRLYTGGIALQILEVRSATPPELVTTIPFLRQAAAVQINEVELHIAAGWDGLALLAGPTARDLHVQVVQFPAESTYTHQLVSTATHLYSAESGDEMAEPYQPGGIRVMERTPRLRQQGFYPVADFADAIVIMGDVLYLSVTQYGSGRPTFTSQLCRLDLWHGVPGPLQAIYAHDQRIHAVVVQGAYAYLATLNPALVILDISVPTEVRVVGMYTAATHGYGLVIRGTYAYIAASNSLHIVDITDPHAPRCVSTYDAHGMVVNVAVAGDIAWLADAQHGVHAVAIANPGAPCAIATYPITGGAWHVEADAHYAYVSAEDKGIFILRVVEPGAA